MSNKAIAIELGLAESTISRLVRSMDSASLAEARRALDGVEALTESERDVLAQVAAGVGRREVALQRGTSPRTIANQVQNGYRKLRIGSKRELQITVSRALASALLPSAR